MYYLEQACRLQVAATQGKFEAVMSAATITEEREKVVAFSLPYYLSEQAILVKEGSPIGGLTDLKGKVVAAQQGTTGLELGKEKAEASELRPYPEGPDAINALKAARHIVRSEPQAKVLVLSLELCTLHMQETDDIEQLLSFLLFADGCSAVGSSV